MLDTTADWISSFLLDRALTIVSGISTTVTIVSSISTIVTIVSSISAIVTIVSRISASSTQSRGKSRYFADKLKKKQL